MFGTLGSYRSNKSVLVSKCFLISCSYNHLMFADYREPLVEVAAQLLVVLLDHETMQQAAVTMNSTDVEHSFEVSCMYV